MHIKNKIGTEIIDKQELLCYNMFHNQGQKSDLIFSLNIEGENMNLTHKEFDVLSCLATADGALTQRKLEETTHHSLSTINRTCRTLSENGLIKDGKITQAGFDVLEPYRAKRAIFIAAGFGSRLVPITLNTPKPLIRVNGKRMIDTMLDACLEAGISEIYIVRGYLSEQFDQLLYKYPMIKFIENPSYNEANNISSAMAARFLLQDAYVLEADLLVSNPKIIRKYHYRSDVLGVWRERTDDWCITEKDGCIDEEKIGGLNCYQMYGVYYLNASDGARLAEDIKTAFLSPGGKELYWEQVPNVMFRGKYRIEIIECKGQDIVEIDTFRELKAVDQTYDV